MRGEPASFNNSFTIVYRQNIDSTYIFLYIMK